MSDSVKFIFKTLIKIPCIIMVVYLIFNLFAFGLTYFRLLGFSYVVMQTAVENNYIPKSELNTLSNYLTSITSTGMVDQANLVTVDATGKSVVIDPVSGTGAPLKQQYGLPVTIGVSAHFKVIWPLTPRAQLADPSQQFVGYTSTPGPFSGFADGATLQQRRDTITTNVKNNINIIYTVPGLKYYPDMAF